MGHFQGIWKHKLHLRLKITPAPEKPPWRALVPISPAPPTAVTAQMGAGWPAPAGQRGYLGISPLPSSQLMPDPLNFTRSKGRAPQTRGKTTGKAPTSFPPRLISQRLFRFAFSKALSAPGAPAAAGPREPGAGVRGSSPPPAAASQDSTVQTHPSSSPPPSQPTWKNIKIPKLLQ